MDDYISRQAAIDALNKYFARIGKLKRRGLTKGEKAISLDTVAALKTFPSAEPKTGEWIIATGMMPPEFHGHHCCSECGNFANMEPPFGNREDLSKFCPNCGAKMVREDGE